jgi:hypothetical protein
MMYIIFSFVIILLALFVGFLAYTLLLKSRWFLGWLRGMSGLLLIVAVIFLGLMAFDVSSYKQLTAEQAIATIRFEEVSAQRYIATFTTAKNNSKRYELYGDQWQLDSRVIKWSAFATSLGINTGYRLDRLAGRYLSLDDERNKPRKVHALNETLAGVDTWLWLNQVDDTITFVDARYGSGVFLPMSHNSLYQIALTNSGLVARPVNQSAKDAVALWQ